MSRMSRHVYRLQEVRDEQMGTIQLLRPRYRNNARPQHDTRSRRNLRDAWERFLIDVGDDSRGADQCAGS